jgi:hypothetical protein
MLGSSNLLLLDDIPSAPHKASPYSRLSSFAGRCPLCVRLHNIGKGNLFVLLSKRPSTPEDHLREGRAGGIEARVAIFPILPPYLQRALMQQVTENLFVAARRHSCGRKSCSEWRLSAAAAFLQKRNQLLHQHHQSDIPSINMMYM